MAEFGPDELRTIMKGCAGEAEGISLDGDFIDVPFEQLGYDSLALLEISHTIEDKTGLVIPDGSIEEMKTPREVIDFVAQSLLGVS